MTNKIKVTGYTVNPAKVNVGTEGSYGMEKLLFAFSSDWEGLNKKVTFYPEEGSTPVSVPIDNEAINVPCEATARSGNVPYTVCGEADGKRIYSVEGCLTVLNARTEVGVPSRDPEAQGGNTGYTEIDEPVTSSMGGTCGATWRGKLYSDGSFDIYTILAFDFTVPDSYSSFKLINGALFGLDSECIALPSAIGEAKDKVVIATENTYYGVNNWDNGANGNVTTSNTRVFDYRDNLYSGATYHADIVVHVLGKKK